MKLVLLILGGCLMVPAVKVAELLRTFNEKLSIRSNLIFINSPCNLEFEQAIQNQKVPRYVISTNRNVTLHPRYDTFVISILFLDNSKNIQQQQLKVLANTVVHCPYCVTLFVSDLPQITNMRWLFEWCWKNNFINAIFVSTTNNSTLFTTYTPFPRLEVVNTTLGIYLRKHYKLKNFQGYTIRFGMSRNIPRSMVYENEKRELMMKGVLPRVLQLFAEAYNATLKRVVLSTDHEVRDCLQLFSENKVDICSQMFFVDRKYDLTQPLFLHKSHLLVPNVRPLPLYQSFEEPFSLSLWIMIAFSLLSITFMLGFVCWYRYSIWCIDDIFLQIFASILYLPFRLPQFSGIQRSFIQLLLIGFGFILSTLYLAFLSSYFSVHIDDKPIRSVADLKDRNISILIDSQDVIILKYYQVSDEFFNRTMVVPTSVLEKHQFALDPSYAYSCALDKCASLLKQQQFLRRPKMVMISLPLASMWAGLLIQNNTFLEVLYNTHIRRVFETGLSFYNFHKGFDDAKEMGFFSYFRTEQFEVDFKSLNIEYFYLPALVLIIGHLIALVVFICEMIIHKYWN